MANVEFTLTYHIFKLADLHICNFLQWQYLNTCHRNSIKTVAEASL